MGPVEKGHSPFPSAERATLGFVMYLSSYLLLGLFLMWGFLPDQWLHAIGFSYFPQKYWAVAVPCFLAVGLFLFVIAYVGANFLLVAPLDDPCTITDASALSCPPGGRYSVPPLYDIPITQINRAMFPPPNSHQKTSATTPSFSSPHAVDPH